MRTTAALTLLLLLGAAALAADEDLTNRTCPVMKGEEVDPDLYLDYKGRRVYFCCEDCVERFRNDPERYVVNLTNTESYYFGADLSEAEAVRVDVKWGDEGEHRYGVLHFVFLHFPLALSAVAALAALLGLVFRGAFYKNAVTFTLILAALFSIPTYFTGEEAEQAKGIMTESLEEAVDQHATLGTLSMYLLLGVAMLHLISRGLPRLTLLRWVAFLAVLAVAGLVAYTGYLGGEVHLGRGHLDAVLPW